MKSIDFQWICVHKNMLLEVKYALGRFVVGFLCALMRECEQLGSLLDGKTLVVYHSAIGFSGRRVLEVFHKPEKQL